MATALEEFKDMLNCPICLELFEDPQILKCLHTICKQCLLELQKQGPVKCPNCRKVCAKDDIKKDFKTQTLLDIHTKTEANKAKDGTPNEKAFKEIRPQVSGCEICRKNAIKWCCMECVKLLCDDCKAMHVAIPACSKHILKPAEDIALPYSARLQETAENLKIYREKVGKQRLKVQCTKQAFLKNKQAMLTNLKQSEDAAKQEIGNHFLKLRQAVEFKSLKYINNVDGILSSFLAVENAFRQHQSEIHNVLKENDYLKIIHHTETACKKIKQEVNAAASLQVEPEDMPKLKLRQQKLTISTVDMIAEEPKRTTEVKWGLQKMSLAEKQKPPVSTPSFYEKMASIQPPVFVHQADTKTVAKTDRNKTIVPKKDKNETIVWKGTPSGSLETQPLRLLETLSLSTLCHQQRSWQIEKQVTAQCIPDQYFHLSCIGKEIWCTVSDRCDIYSTDGDYLRQFQNEAVGKPYHVLQTIRGDLLVAGSHGFFLFDKHEQQRSILSVDRYVNICLLLSASEEVVCGLNKWSKEAVAYKNMCHGKWDKFGAIALPEVDDVRDTIVGNTKYLYVCLYSHGVICQHEIAMGKQLRRIGIDDQSIGVILNCPYICHLDKNGWLLVCDSGNKRIVSFDEEEKLTQFDFGVDINPGYVLLDTTGKLWVYHNGLKLVKFQGYESGNPQERQNLSCDEKQELLKLI